MFDYITVLALLLAYLCVALILFVVLAETVENAAGSEEEPPHVVIALLWPWIFIVGFVNLMKPTRKDPPAGGSTP